MTATTEIATLEQDARRMTAEINAVEVVDRTSYEQAGEMVRQATAYIRRVEDVLGPIVSAAHKAHQVAVQQRDMLLRPAQGAKRVLGERMAAWEAEQSRRRREAEETARRDRERQERAAREAAELERRRHQALAEEERLREAADLEATGDREGADRLLEQPLPDPHGVVAPPRFAPRPPPAEELEVPAVAGVSYRQTWDYEVTDEAAVPREFLMIDHKRVAGVVRALGEKANIPGIRPVVKRTAAVRL